MAMVRANTGNNTTTKTTHVIVSFAITYVLLLVLKARKRTITA